MPISVIVMDGRIGRDPSAPREELHRFESERPFDGGERLTLPDGVEVTVVGGSEVIDANGMIQTVFVGDTWDV